VIPSGRDFRVPPPSAAAATAEIAEVKNFQRTPKTNAAAYFWGYAVGGAVTNN
jgi:hypothetical protein